MANCGFSFITGSSSKSGGLKSWEIAVITIGGVLLLVLMGGMEGCIQGPVRNRKTACYVYEQKLDNKRFWGQQSKNKSQGQAQPGGAKKKTKEKKVG